MTNQSQTTRPDRCPPEGCPACGRLPGEGCGRDDLPGKRIGCWLLGGPLQPVSAQSKTTRLNGSVPTEQQRDALEDAMWQLLDDMGMDGLSVCMLAKAKARVAFEPFAWDEDATESLMPLADAERIVKRCEE